MSQQPAVRETTFLILSALAPGRLQGWAIKQDTEAATQGRVQMGPGTLYTCLSRLVAEGLVADSGSEIADGRLRHNYELTDEGLAVLNAEVHRLRANANVAASRLRARSS